jgi:hypothetical protein
MMLYRIFLGVLLVLCAGEAAQAQDYVPVISGAVGFLSTTSGGTHVNEPIIVPVLSAPIGDHILIEARGGFEEFFVQPNGTGPTSRQFFGGLDYAQVDVIVNSWLTLVGGKFITPFGIYNERLLPIWIHNLQNAPIIFTIGTRNSSESLGGMARGVFTPAKDLQVNYTAYYSTTNQSANWGAARTAGGRVGFFLPEQRFEVGVSYQRYLQDTHMNSFGAYLSWQPYSAPLDFKGEFAHSLNGYGYWAEAAYRLSRFRGPDSLVGRLQPVVRVQQFVRKQFTFEDASPGANTQEADLGVDYYLPHEIRFNADYGRQFSSQGNENIWDVGITYRFMLPLWPGGHR